MPPRIDIIMRAKNEMPHVQRVLDSLSRQTFGKAELFVVDSGSSDGTLEALLKYGGDARVTQIPPDSYEPGRVLNTAIAETRHEIIVLLNADAVPCSDDFLETLLRPLIEQEADAVFARQVARADARFVVADDYRRAYRKETMADGFFSAVACAFRRSLWQKVPFRESGYAEDLAWANACRSMEARIRFVPKAVVEHSHNYTLKALYRKRFRQAATFDERPCIGKQMTRCLREILRDLYHACIRLKLHTIPYNIAYRCVIHAAVYRGLRYRCKNAC